MIRTLLIATLSLSTAVSTVLGVNVPYTHSLVKRTSRVQVPRTLLEKKEFSPNLIARQDTCDAGEVACSGGGCCEGSCCGDGCCPDAYVCNFVGTTPACCPVGETCSDQISGCTDPTLVECGGSYDFCCPIGEACGLDANNNAECGGVVIGTGNGTGNGNGTTTGTTTNVPVAAPTLTTTTPVVNTGLTTPTTSTHGGILSIFNSLTSSILNGTPTPTGSTSSNHASGAGQVVVGSGMLGMVALAAGAMIL